MCALGLCLHKPFPPSGRHPPHLTPPVSVLPPWHSCRKSSMIHWLTVASFPLSSPPSLLLGSSKGAGHIHPHVSWSLTGQLISACLLHPQPLPRALRRIRTQYWGQHLTSSLSDFSPCVPSTQRPSFIHSFIHLSICQTQSAALFQACARGWSHSGESGDSAQHLGAHSLLREAEQPSGRRGRC